MTAKKAMKIPSRTMTGIAIESQFFAIAVFLAV
jgi:hypothetical protein